MLIHLVTMLSTVKATPPPPQKRPVECGRPGTCSEAAGLREPDELHEVCASNPSYITPD